MEYLLQDIVSVLAEFIVNLPYFALLIVPAALIGAVQLYGVGRIVRSADLSVARSVRISAWVAGVALLLGLAASFIVLLPEPWYSRVDNNFAMGAGIVLLISTIWILMRKSNISLAKSISVAVPVLLISVFFGFFALFLFAPFS